MSKHSNSPEIWLCCLLLMLSSSLCWGQIDPIIRVTEALKPNVVAIQTTFADGSTENGFGFITGEKNGQLYLVTAGHVVHGREAKTLQKIQVRFYSTLRQYPAEEENWFEADDLSLLTLPKPATVEWNPLLPTTILNPTKLYVLWAKTRIGSAPARVKFFASAKIASNLPCTAWNRAAQVRR